MSVHAQKKVPVATFYSCYFVSQFYGFYSVCYSLACQTLQALLESVSPQRQERSVFAVTLSSSLLTRNLLSRAFVSILARVLEFLSSLVPFPTLCPHPAA